MPHISKNDEISRINKQKLPPFDHFSIGEAHGIFCTMILIMFECNCYMLYAARVH